MKFLSLLVGASAVTMIASPASAQSYRDLQNGHQSEVRVSAGITIPFGGKKHTVETKPRFDLGFEQRVQRNDVLLAVNPANSNHASELPQWRRTSFSLTFEDNPRILMNGQQVARFNLTARADEGEGAEQGKSGGGNTALIVGGVVLGGLLVATVVTAADAADALTDLVDPD